jgi:Superfamily II DNA/RNA helicases, SNF2 family
MVASGTPCPNSELELWGQMKFVNNDLLHDSFYAFRNTYFHLGRGRQVMHVPQGKVMSRGMMRELLGSGWKYQITDEMRERLMEKIKPFVHWVKKSDALDLPEKIDELREVRLNPNEKRMYKEMEKLLITEVKGTAVTAEVALAKLMKLRQASAGFLYDEEHNALRPGKSSKMRELEDTLEDLGNQQVIIWVQFTEEVAAIGRLITEMGRSFTTLHGATEDKDASIKAFQSNSVQYLIAHPRSAGHGLTFVNCSAAVYFSLDYSYESHEQSRDRIHRIGQVNKCLYIYLLAKDTIDTAVLQVLRRKKSLQDLVYEIMKKG